MRKSFLYTMQELTKGFDFSPWGGIDGFLKATSNGASGSNKAAALKRLVPDLSHAVDMTATAISSLPFDIVSESGDIIDSSASWKNELGGMSDPKRLLYLIASSLCGGAAYVIPTRTPKMIFDLQYAVPHSINPYIDMDGLRYFDRITEQGKAERYDPKDLIYFWLPDSDVEIGPALNTPLSGALSDAELILNTTRTMVMYGERGFVPIIAMGAKGMPADAEKQKAEKYFDRLLRGGFDVLAKIFNAESLSIERLGAGMDELKGAYVEIRRDSSEGIAKSFGIPTAMFLSDNAFASEFDALTRQWYTASRFRSIYQTIEGTFTSQLYKQYGASMVFNLQSLDIFQEDEAQRSASLNSFVSAVSKSPTIAKLGMSILGYDLDEEQEAMYTEVVKEKEEDKKKIEESMNEQPVDGEQPKEEKPFGKSFNLSPTDIKDLALWQQMAVRFYRKGKGAAVDFECKTLSEDIAAPIRVKLANAKSEHDIKKAFELTSESMLFSPQVKALQELADAINKAVEKGQC